MVCAVTFQRHGRLYYADPGGLSLQVGDQVLYPTNDGPEVAEVMWAPQYVSEEIGRLPVLLGAATASDLERAAVSHKKRASARVAARRLIREHDLPMKVSGVDYVNDRNHTTIYFTAPHRVDFRALVRDLSATLHGRVELRQLSARDEARLTGFVLSLGPGTRGYPSVRLGASHERIEQFAHPPVDLVADHADLVEAAAGRVVQLPA